MLETELKFAVHAAFLFDPASLDGAGIAHAEELSLLDLRATYYDTTDMRLARNGITLRYRRGDEHGPSWDLKLPVKGGDGVAREELNFDGSPGRVPEEIKELVTAFTRSAPLGPVATLRTRRRRWSIGESSDRPLAVLFDDEVSVLEGRRVVARFRELEVEARAADRAQLERIGDALRAAGAVRAEPIPKVVRALGPQATSAPDIVVGTGCDPGDPAAAAIRYAIAASVHRLLTHDPATRLGEPEGVHQMRVAARRIRSDLRTFGSLLVTTWTAKLTEELRWLANVLGEVRDLDVLQERLHETGEDLEDDLKPLWRVLSDRHAQARAELVAALRSQRYLKLLEALVEAARSPVVTAAAAEPCRTTLPPLVERTWKKLAREGRALRSNTADEKLHDVRIRAKRARYASEAVAPCLGPRGDDAKRFAKLVEGVQDVLGRHQDARLARDTIMAVVKEVSENGAFHLAAGQLVERERRVALDARAMFPKTWRKLDKRKNRAWLTV